MSTKTYAQIIITALLLRLHNTHRPLFAISCFRDSYLLALAFASVFIWNNIGVRAQTFVDRQTPYAVRVVTYNVYIDSLFNDPTYAPDELDRFITAVDADVWSFQEAFDHSASDLISLFNQLAPLGGGESWKAHKGRNQIIVSKYNLSMLETDVPGGTRGIAMALVDLPDAHFSNDLYVLNNHFPCCESGESQRQIEAQAISDWILDARTPGGNVNLPQGTGIAVLGDLNFLQVGLITFYTPTASCGLITVMF